MTEKLFYENSHLAEFEAAVTKCRQNGEYFEVELDRTAFFPEGGGQYVEMFRCWMYRNAADIFFI